MCENNKIQTNINFELSKMLGDGEVPERSCFPNEMLSKAPEYLPASAELQLFESICFLHH